MIAVCMVCSAFFEWAYEKILNKPNTVRDGSALVTGLILALNLPANLTHLDGIEYPIFMPILICIIGSFVAIVVVKQLFGGMGRNFANPAIVGRITLFLSFTSYMSTWPLTRFQKAGIDAVTGATPLGYLADGDLTYCPSLKDMFLGNIGGAMGETCVIAILIGAIFLIAMKIISPIIPVCFVATVFIFAFLYYAISGNTPEGMSALYMACFHVCAGGVMFGAVFCATDYVTSPIMPLGKVLFENRLRSCDHDHPSVLLLSRRCFLRDPVHEYHDTYSEQLCRGPFLRHQQTQKGSGKGGCSRSKESIRRV
jgi:electron transport complex protein RnfD